MVQLVKNPPAMQKIWVRSLGWDDPLEKGTHSNMLAWRISWDYTVHGVAKSQTRLSNFHFHFLYKDSTGKLLVRMTRIELMMMRW